MFSKCGTGEALESPLDSKDIKPVNPIGNQPWIFIGRTDAKAPILWPPHVKSQPTHWKRPWCWERLRAGGEGSNRGWDGWMVSLIQWTWVWVNPGNWWWTGRPGMLQSMGLQSVRHDWVTELKVKPEYSLEGLMLKLQYFGHLFPTPWKRP